MSRDNQRMELAKTHVSARVRAEHELIRHTGATPKTVERVILNALIATPAIADCTMESLELAVIRSIEHKLMPDGNEAAIIPYGKEAAFVPMVNGKRKLVREANKGVNLRSRVVFEQDHWRYEEGLNVILEHKPNENATRHPDSIIAAYAIAKFPDGDFEFEVIFKPDIARARARGRASAWKTDTAEMVRKTVEGLLYKRQKKHTGAHGPDPNEYKAWEAAQRGEIHVPGSDFGTEIQTETDPPAADPPANGVVDPPAEEVKPAQEEKPRQTGSRRRQPAKPDPEPPPPQEEEPPPPPEPEEEEPPF